jgi:hypothetical protein
MKKTRPPTRLTLVLAAVVVVVVTTTASWSSVHAFSIMPLSKTSRVTSIRSQLNARKRTIVLVDEPTTDSLDPFDMSSKEKDVTIMVPTEIHNKQNIVEHSGWKKRSTAMTVMMIFSAQSAAVAATLSTGNIFSQGELDPSTFQPVCPASDGFYRFLQSSTAAVVGPESFIEYGPLIAGGLLRVRLELCVVESFVEEAVVPFIQRNGLNWVLPLHETVETFIAGTIFAVADTFILIGSTKLVNVIVFFTDLLLGAPARLFGGFVYDRALGKPVTLDVGLGPFKTRVIGPPEEDIQSKLSNAEERSATDIVVIGLSGVVKYTGDALKVRQNVVVVVFVTC